MLEEANQAAHDITLGAFNYADDIMEKIEKQLQIYYDVVQDGKDEIQRSLDALKQRISSGTLERIWSIILYNSSGSTIILSVCIKARLLPSMVLSN